MDRIGPELEDQVRTTGGVRAEGCVCSADVAVKSNSEWQVSRALYDEDGKYCWIKYGCAGNLRTDRRTRTFAALCATIRVANTTVEQATSYRIDDWRISNVYRRRTAEVGLCLDSAGEVLCLITNTCSEHLRRVAPLLGDRRGYRNDTWVPS